MKKVLVLISSFPIFRSHKNKSENIDKNKKKLNTFVELFNIKIRILFNSIGCSLANCY